MNGSVEAKIPWTLLFVSKEKFKYIYVASSNWLKFFDFLYQLTKDLTKKNLNFSRGGAPTLAPQRGRPTKNDPHDPLFLMQNLFLL